MLLLAVRDRRGGGMEQYRAGPVEELLSAVANRVASRFGELARAQATFIDLFNDTARGGPQA